MPLVLEERKSPTPHGVGGLKYSEAEAQECDSGPTPHGVGGLKFKTAMVKNAIVEVGGLNRAVCT